MARKTSRRIRPKAKPPSPEELLDSMARRMKKRFPNRKLQPNRGDQEKMSDVLEAFIDPYIDDAPNDETYRKLISLGVIAWNTALMDEETQAEAIAHLEEVVPVKERGDFRHALAELMARKQQIFPHNQRRILDYQLTDLGSQWHLSVVSTPAPEDKPEDTE